MDASLDEGEASKHITFLAAAVPVGGHIHVRLGLGRAVGLGYVEGRRAARGASFHEAVKVTPFWVAVAEWT